MQQTITVNHTPVQINGPEGPQAAQAPCIVLLHGWPDTLALWDATVAQLAPHYRCARFTWPGFGAGDAARPPSLADLVALLHQVVLAVGGGQPVTLLLHDWGCLFGYQFALQHPNLVARVVGVDVGDAGSSAHRAALKPKQMLMAAGYQLWLAIAWRLGGPLGDRMARWMARTLQAPTPQAQVRAAAGYPYWLTWTGAYRTARPFVPAMPMLYVYGKRKPFMFQSRAWCDALARHPGSRVQGLAAGHWVMLDAAPAFHAALVDWLQATDTRSLTPASSAPARPG